MMIILQLILALIFQNSGDIFYLIEMEGFGFASVLVMTFAGQVYLRFKEPDLPRPIKVGFLLSWVKTFTIIPEFSTLRLADFLWMKVSLKVQIQAKL